jgi:phosphatidylserine/phosphatidylglycerophosphate/cardiolipin synthase-like enzyme
MGRTFSLPSEALGAYLGYALLHYDEIAIVSPWVSDVQVSFPVNNRDIEPRQYLSEAIETFGDEVELTIYLRGGQEHNDYIKSKLGQYADIELVDDLHAKTIVTADSAYVGSANLTHNGLSVHRELCHIIENEYATIDDYIREELDL